MPASHDWLTFTEWSKKYGDLTRIKLFGTDVIYTNSLEVAHELFEKRSSVYSCRPQSTMLLEM